MQNGKLRIVRNMILKPMKNKCTVSVGIPAYNEEKNIARLLTQLLSQQESGVRFDHILVISDGSTDNTVSEIKKIKDKKIMLRINTNREGKAATLNEIISVINSDILVFMDADVHIKDISFLKKLVHPILANQSDVATAKVMEITPRNRFEKMLALSMNIKKEVAQIYREGKNIYTCHGRSLAIGKKLYKKIKFPKGLIADDAYIYLYAYTKNFRYSYVKDAKIYYTLPKTLKDHQKQSHRFLSTQKQLYNIFGDKVTKKEYALPLLPLIRVTTRYAIKNPFVLLRYMSVLGYMKLQSLIMQPAQAKWETAISSK